MCFRWRKWLTPPPPPNPPSRPQCLKAEDIASAVTFVLSAPPHVQVLKSFCIFATAFPSARIDFALASSDRRRADEAGGTGLVAALQRAAGGADIQLAMASP